MSSVAQPRWEVVVSSPSPTFTPEAPPRSLDQRLLALQAANEVRSRRARLKRSLRAQPEIAVAMITRPPVWAESMKVGDLLLAVPKFGRVKVTKVLRAVQIAPSRTLGGLTPRQRIELVDALPTRAVRTPPARRNGTAADTGATT